MKFFFERHKEKYIKENRLLYNWLYLWNVMNNQFEYTGLPDTLPAEYIEGYLMTTGSVGICETDGGLYAGMGGYVGDINGYLPRDYECTPLGKQSVRGYAVGVGCNNEPDEGSKIIVGWNNSMRSPDLDIFDTAGVLTETQTSEDINVIFSRLLRIPIARNSKEEVQINNAIKAIIEGRIEAVSSALESLDTLINGEKPMQFLDLTDPKDVDKLQYLNQFKDNKLKHFFQRHGYSYNVTTKLAQQTNAEMHGGDDVSLIYPLQQLEYRQIMIDNLNRVHGEKYGFNASVEFKKLLKNAYDRVINYVPDELNEKGVVDDEIPESDTPDSDNVGDDREQG